MTEVLDAADINLSAENEEKAGEQVRIRMDKLTAMQALNVDPFRETTYDVTKHADEILKSFDELEGATVRVAGRLMGKRGMGKVSFTDLQDRSGRIQIFTKISLVKRNIKNGWTLTWGILSELKERFFAPKKVRSLSVTKNTHS